MSAPRRRIPTALLLAAAAALLALAGCAKEPERNLAPVMVARKAPGTAPAAPAAPPSPAKAAPAAPAPAAAPAPSLLGKDNVLALPVFPAGELYNPAGKRNPFLPYMRASRGGAGKGGRDVQKVPPLQRADLSEFQYVGILKTRKGVQALLETGDGKGYSVQLGSRLGRDNGVVTDITAKQITVRESATDDAGRTTVREVLIRNKNANAGGKQ